MKKFYRMWVWSMLLLGTLIPSVVMAASEAAAAETPATNSFSPDHLKGRLGFGLTYSTDSSLYYLVDARCWFEDKTALDLYAAGSYSEQKGVGFNGLTANFPYWSYSCGLGLRETLAAPVPDVHVLAIQRVLFSSRLFQSGSYSILSKDQVQTLTGFLGLGFEAFVPFWRSLSIEGSVGVRFGCQWEQQIQVNNGFGAPDTVTEWDFASFTAGSNNDTTTLLGAGVHFYF